MVIQEKEEGVILLNNVFPGISGGSYIFTFDMKEDINSGKIIPYSYYDVNITGMDISFNNRVWKSGDSFVITIPKYYFQAGVLNKSTGYNISLVKSNELLD